MGMRGTVTRVGRRLYLLLSSGEGRDQRAPGAADRLEERDRLFEVFARGGIAGHGTTPPGGEPPHNLRGSRPDREED
jgi:hypothetical protein